MNGKFKLSTKLYTGFGVGLLLVVIVAGISIWSVDGLIASGDKTTVKGNQKMFMQERVADHLHWVGSVKDLFLNNAETLKVQLDPAKCNLGKFLNSPEAREMAAGDPKLAALLEEIKAPHAHLHQSASKIKDAWRQNHPGLTDTLAARLDDHRRWAESVANSLLNKEPLQVETDPAKCAFGKWLQGEEVRRLAADWPEFAALIAQVAKDHTSLHQSAALINQAGSGEEKLAIYQAQTLPALKEVADRFHQVEKLEMGLAEGQQEAHHIYESETLPALNDLGGFIQQITAQLDRSQKATQREMVSTGEITHWTTIVVTIAGLILGVLLSYLITRSITRPLNRIIHSLNSGADQVSSAAGQLSDSAQQLAEGSSEQAASLEETSSSMEEMNSMTKSNAENSDQADALMKEMTTAVDGAGTAMGEVTDSMARISTLGGETGKIVKSIDEIAFQTNLLALNAAVEAARAGEAGAGFAVVADEVRSLAMRAAEAAKSTQSLVEDMVQGIGDGSSLVAKAQDGFSRMIQAANRVTGLISEIAAASQEQAQGINQINLAMSQLDRVTQSNAASAEESASASEELSAQAESMTAMVNELVALVNGAGGNGLGRSGNPLLDQAGGSRPALAGPKPGRGRVVDPGQAVPFEDDLEEF